MAIAPACLLQNGQQSEWAQEICDIDMRFNEIGLFRQTVLCLERREHKSN